VAAAAVVAVALVVVSLGIGLLSLSAAALVAALLALAARGARALLLIATRARLTGRIRTNTSHHPRLALCVLPPAPMASCAAGRAPLVTEGL
jgi:hypothetical protein